MVMRSFIAATFAVSMSIPAAYADSQSSEAGINVVLNNAKVVKLSRPASTVIIGNPEIVDATVQDAETIVLTGRGFGRTNIVILDKSGTPVLDEKIAVSRDVNALVRVYRRAEVENLSCEPECNGAYLSEAETQARNALRLANEGPNDGEN